MTIDPTTDLDPKGAPADYGVAVFPATFDPITRGHVAIAERAARVFRRLVFGLLFVAAIVLLTIVGTFLRGPYWNFYWPWQPWPELPSRI